MAVRQNIQKLVRDKVVPAIFANGETPVSRQLSGDEADRAYRFKVIEEANEIWHSITDDELCKEAGDLLEIIEENLKRRNMCVERPTRVAEMPAFEAQSFKEEDQSLRCRLAEQANKLLHMQTHGELMKGFADVLVTLEALLLKHNIPLEKLMYLRKEKRERLGGFETATYLEYIIQRN